MQPAILQKYSEFLVTPTVLKLTSLLVTLTMVSFPYLSGYQFPKKIIPVLPIWDMSMAQEERHCSMNTYFTFDHTKIVAREGLEGLNFGSLFPKLFGTISASFLLLLEY